METLVFLVLLVWWQKEVTANRSAP